MNIGEHAAKVLSGHTIYSHEPIKRPRKQRPKALIALTENKKLIKKMAFEGHTVPSISRHLKASNSTVQLYIREVVSKETYEKLRANAREASRNSHRQSKKRLSSPCSC